MLAYAVGECAVFGAPGGCALVPVGDEAAFAAELAALLTQPARLGGMRVAAAAHAARLHDALSAAPSVEQAVSDFEAHLLQAMRVAAPIDTSPPSPPSSSKPLPAFALGAGADVDARGGGATTARQATGRTSHSGGAGRAHTRNGGGGAGSDSSSGGGGGGRRRITMRVALLFLLYGLQGVLFGFIGGALPVLVASAPCSALGLLSMSLLPFALKVGLERKPTSLMDVHHVPDGCPPRP